MQLSPQLMAQAHSAALAAAAKLTQVRCCWLPAALDADMGAGKAIKPVGKHTLCVIL
jgi:hypothetical protein